MSILTRKNIKRLRLNRLNLLKIALSQIEILETRKYSVFSNATPHFTKTQLESHTRKLKIFFIYDIFKNEPNFLINFILETFLKDVNNIIYNSVFNTINSEPDFVFSNNLPLHQTNIDYSDYNLVKIFIIIDLIQKIIDSYSYSYPDNFFPILCEEVFINKFMLLCQSNVDFILDTILLKCYKKNKELVKIYG